MATVVKVLGRQGNRLNIARRECSCEVKLPFGLRFTDGGKMHRVHVCPQCERLHGYEDIRKGTLLRSQVVFAPGLPLLSKALELKAGQRWVTLHPDAENPENYVHVLIQEHPDGTASVIRGAEGKLNYLRLTKLKSPEDWQESGKRLAEERERRRKEREAAMTEEERQTTHDVEAGILARKELEDAKYVSQVMEAHGIGESDWKLEEKTLVALPGKSREMAEKQHLRKMVTVANKLVDRTRKDLLDAHDRLAEAELGDMPLGDVGIERPLEGKGSGYIAAVENAAEAAGLSVRQKIAEKEDISWRGFLDRSDGDPLKAAEKLAAVQRLHAALREVREPIKELRTAGLLDRPLKPELPPTEKIADILVAQKQHTDYERQYRQVKGEIEEHGVPKAALEVVTELRPEEVEEIIRAAAAKPLDEEAAKDKVAEELAEDAMQRAAERLLATADKEEALQPLRKYVTMGHYDSLNRSCLAATRTPLPLGRLQADILGPEASAQVLAAHLRETLSDTDYRAALHGVANYHRNYQRQASEQALQSYASTKQQADELSERPISDIGSLVEAQVANADRIDLVDEARETLGVALGRLEATAALVQALELQHARKGVPEELRVPLGAISNQQAIAQARVLGLSHPVMEEMEPGVEPDYRIDSDGVNKFLTILPNGAAKLLTKPDRELAEKHALATEIKSGRRDQTHWLPAGIVSRPQSTFEDPEKRAVQFSEPLELRPKMRYAEVKRGLKHYIARRLADGQDPESLRSDLLSAEFTADLPDDLLGDGGGSYYKALSDLGWFTYNQVENKSPEGLEAIAEHAVEEYEREHGASEEVAALNSQSIPLKDSPVCYEALYRAVAAHPEARVAFKALSELTPEERGLIQRFFYRVMTEEKSPQEEAEEKRLTARPTQAPARQEALWAEQEVPAETTEARKPAKPGRETPWTRYVKAQGSVQHAYESVQDVMRGAVSAQFAKHMGGILGRELKTGNKRIANWDDHLLGLVSPERQQQLLEARQAEMARKHARVATRARGKFATEERLGIRRERAEALDRAIRGAALSLFKEKPLPAIERVTIGARAEKQLQSIFPYVAQNFEVDRPVDIPHDVNMSEGEMVKQQRAVKLIEGLKRLSLNLGVGTGKTLVALGSFSDLQARGAVNRAIFAVPASLTGQFGAEALRFYEPGRFKWFADPTASAEDRRAAYTDPDRQICVVTHQALRDDLVWAVGQDRFGGNVRKAEDWMRAAPEDERRHEVKTAVDKQGWKFNFALSDEAHDLLNRKGKPNSLMANAIDGLTDTMPYYVTASADPIKNDSSEVYSLLHRIAPDRYDNAEEFHRRYGIDCLQTQQALRQEMHPYAYAERIPLGIVASRRQEPVQLSAPEQSEYDGVLEAYRTAQTARRAGKVDDAVPALRQMNPRAFEGKNEAEQRTEAGRMLQFLSAARDSALDRIVNAGSVRGAGVRIPAKLETLHAFVQSRIAEKGAGLVFAHSIEAQKQIAGYLKSKGIKVGTLSGSDPGAKRERTRQDFQAGKFDVLCLSDAGSTGLNLQRAAFCCNFDSPYTAKTYEQRIGRMERLGQTNPDMKVLDLVTTTPYERGRRRLLERKGKLREALTAPYEMLDDTDLGREIAEARSSEIEKAVLKAA